MVESSLLRRLVVCMIPMNGDQRIRKRWEAVREALRTYQLNLPEYEERGMYYAPNRDLSIHRSASFQRFAEALRQLEMDTGAGQAFRTVAELLELEANSIAIVVSRGEELRARTRRFAAVYQPKDVEQPTGGDLETTASEFDRMYKSSFDAD